VLAEKLQWQRHDHQVSFLLTLTPDGHVLSAAPMDLIPDNDLTQELGHWLSNCLLRATFERPTEPHVPPLFATTVRFKAARDGAGKLKKTY
jgi:hypothetical protein